MKTRTILTACAAALLCSAAALAQAPAGAPAGSTGKCKDGSFTSAASKSGACSGHKGVDSFWAAAASKPAPAPAPAPMAKPAPAAAPAPAPAPMSMPMAASKPAPAAKGAKTPAPGGGPGLVWVNTGTKVYHCYGKEDYGTTKAGKYETEAQAKADGARPAYNKPCTM